MNTLTALVLILLFAVAPSVAFVLLWEGLCLLRDDALIADLEAAHGLELTAGGAVTGFAALSRSPSATTTLETCPTCDVRTGTDGGVCVGCGGRLERETDADCEPSR